MSATAIVRRLLEDDDDFDPKEVALDLISMEAIAARHGFEVVDGEEPAAYRHMKFGHGSIVVSMTFYGGNRGYNPEVVGKLDIGFWERRPDQNRGGGVSGWMNSFVLPIHDADRVLVELEKRLAAAKVDPWGSPDNAVRDVIKPFKDAYDPKRRVE